MENIRNFIIIAHIDHGKSTLADRFLEITGTVEPRRMKEQYLDQLDLERERGVTIKMAPVRMIYKINHAKIQNSKSEILNKFKIQNSKFKTNSFEFRASDFGFTDSEFILNLIDTPGHPDFSYEVSRALAAVEGGILLVDATRGIQAQTLANFYAAKRGETDLKIIGAVNKIDLNPTQLPTVIKETAKLIGCDEEAIHKISAKTGDGVRELLKAVIMKIPAPQTQADFTQNNAKNIRRSSASLPPSSAIGARALIFDSFYDDHKGIIASVRIFNGEIKNSDEIYFIAADTYSRIKEVGYFSPQLKPTEKLTEGEIGYIATGVKDPEKIKIGDTVIKFKFPNSKSKITAKPLPGYQEPKPVVFVSLYPERSNDYNNFKKALQKLKLNDSALKFEPDFNEVLGRGFKVGFLGKFHFEIISERLEREFKIKTINSFPSVSYKVKSKRADAAKNKYITINNPKDLPEDCAEIWEPMATLKIVSPAVYMGNIFQLKEVFRMENIQYQNRGDKVLIAAEMPLAELISDFDDKLKSVSNGFASFSYEFSAGAGRGDELDGYQKADLKKLEILLAGEPVAGLAKILPAKKIEAEARRLVKRLKEILPRQQFNQAVQATAAGRIIARETIHALKKDVTGHLYGGDRTRKTKLWKKQKAGKKKLKERGQAKIPAELFKKIIK